MADDKQGSCFHVDTDGGESGQALVKFLVPFPDPAIGGVDEPLVLPPKSGPPYSMGN